MTAVFQRELGSYYKGILGYLFAAFLLLFAGIYTMAYNLSGSYSNFEYVLSSISFIYLIAVPILSMRTVAEERRAKTDQLLYALPISMADVVLGKYLAMLVVLAVPVCVMGVYPLLLTQFGIVYLPTAYGTLFAFFMLGAALLSIGLFVSSITENQVAAAVITLVAMLLLYFMTALSSFISSAASASMVAIAIAVGVFALILYFLTKNSVFASAIAIVGAGGTILWYSLDSSAFTNLFPSILASISLFERFDGFVDGVFDLTAIVFYLSVIAVFLFLTVQALEKRRWSE